MKHNDKVSANANDDLVRSWKLGPEMQMYIVCAYSN